MAIRDVVVLVDEAGNVQGTKEKISAHEAPGDLHLAFSVLLYRPDGKLLIQQRAAGKYHFPLMWANACCSHPGPGEDVLTSAKNRVVEELGIHCELEEKGAFIYRATCRASGRVEHELDHVFVGHIEQEPVPDPSEIAALRWVDAEELRILEAQGMTVPWLHEALDLASNN